MAPDTTAENVAFEVPKIPNAQQRFSQARLIRIAKTFRFVAPIEVKDRTPEQSKYGKEAYRVGYQLSNETAAELAKAADSKCYKCLGTGIKDWRNHGTAARICACAQPFLNTPRAAAE